MNTTGYYYLHSESKDLIFKPEIVVDSDPEYFNSPFVQKVWHIDTSNREDAWRIVLESLALGIKLERAKELSRKWGCNYEDSHEMLLRVESPTQLSKDGMTIFIKEILKMDVEEYWAKFDIVAKAAIDKAEKL